MKSLRWILALGMLLPMTAWGESSAPTWQPPQEDEIYEVQDLKRTAEYLLESAVNCREVIWLRIKEGAVSHEEREKLFYLLPSYRIAGLKVYPISEELFMLAPEYKSCVRMLHHTRGHSSISLTEKETAALKIARDALRELGVEKMSRSEAARALHDWIVLHAAYDVENANFDRVYGVDEYTPFDGKYLLLEGKGVCDSYVQAYWLLLQMCGVPCSMMSGYVPQYKQGHAWSLVYMDDHWAHVDTTFDDPVPDKAGQVVHTNFDKTDEEMRESRSWVQDMFPNTRQSGFLSESPAAFNSLEELLAWLKQNPLPEDHALLVDITGLPATAATIQQVQQAAGAAGIPLSAGHDPLYPHALRLRRLPSAAASSPQPSE